MTAPAERTLTAEDLEGRSWPIEAMKDAAFLLIGHGDGRGTEAALGWEALVQRVNEDSGVELHTDDMLDEWEWSDERPSLPYYLHLSFEAEGLTIVRVSEEARAALAAAVIDEQIGLAREIMTELIEDEKQTSALTGQDEIAGLRGERDELQAAIDRRVVEREAILLQVFGGEDAPGYAASRGLKDVRDAMKWWRDTLQEETARATAAEARVAALEAGLRPSVEETASRIVRDVAELGDRTSPEDDPEQMGVTTEELHGIVVAALLATAPERPEPTGAEMGAVLHLFREFVISNATQWKTGAGANGHPMWALVAEALGDTKDVRSGPEWQFIQPDFGEPEKARCAFVRPASAPGFALRLDR